MWCPVYLFESFSSKIATIFFPTSEQTFFQPTKINQQIKLSYNYYRPHSLSSDPIETKSAFTSSSDQLKSIPSTVVSIGYKLWLRDGTSISSREQTTGIFPVREQTTGMYMARGIKRPVRVKTRAFLPGWKNPAFAFYNGFEKTSFCIVVD